MQLLVLSPLQENKDAQGDLAELTNIESKELAKFSDAVIASLMTQDGSATGIGYRTDSPDIERQYFHPRAYQYTQKLGCDSSSDNRDDNDRVGMRFTDKWSSEQNPHFWQCQGWGGCASGINCWYKCNFPGSNGGYTKVVHTCSRNDGAGIVDKYASSGYEEDDNIVQMWVR